MVMIVDSASGVASDKATVASACREKRWRQRVKNPHCPKDNGVANATNDGSAPVTAVIVSNVEQSYYKYNFEGGECYAGGRPSCTHRESQQLY